MEPIPPLLCLTANAPHHDTAVLKTKLSSMLSVNRRRRFTMDDYIQTDRVSRFQDVSAFGASADLNLGKNGNRQQIFSGYF